MDQVTMGNAFSRPGADPRQWVSCGTVDADTPDARSVRFVDDEGNPLPTGPLVKVTLQPSGITVVCRVASFIAGVGEGSWVPFQEKDEVVVLIPQGSERSSPVIVGRMNQELDVWPAIVAGQDATKNTFGFWRLRTPFIVESAESFLIRSAKTGSQIGIDATGQVVLNNGDKNNIFIGSDAISISSGDDETFLQLNFSENRITAATGLARVELSASGNSIFQVPGTLNIGTSGVAGRGHAITVEQVVGMFANFIVLLKNAGVPGLAPILLTPAALDAVLAPMITAMATPAPPGTPVAAFFGNYALLPATNAAMVAALANPIAIFDPTGFVPGVGRGSLLY